MQNFWTQPKKQTLAFDIVAYDQLSHTYSNHKLTDTQAHILVNQIITKRIHELCTRIARRLEHTLFRLRARFHRRWPCKNTITRICTNTYAKGCLDFFGLTRRVNKNKCARSRYLRYVFTVIRTHTQRLLRLRARHLISVLRKLLTFRPTRALSFQCAENERITRNESSWITNGIKLN